MQIKHLRFLLTVIITVQILVAIFSCSENPHENHICPPIDIVSQPPYNNPIWHPNGNYIGFNYTPLDSITYPYGKDCIGNQHFNYESTGFWLINIDGTNKRRILPYQLFLAAWSPDGNWIAFVYNAQIYKMPYNSTEEKFDTTQIQQLTFEGRNFCPAWSPDGMWITFDSNKDSPNGMNFIWKMRIDGTQKIRITYEPTIGEIRMPNWSDNEIILHIRYSPDFFSSEIYIMDNNGFNPTRLTFNDVTDSYPQYSPHGAKIAFWSSGNIWLMDTMGANLRQVTTNTVDVNFGLPFSWSPDGQKIVYTQHNYNEWSYANGVLWIIDINTGIEHQLTF